MHLYNREFQHLYIIPLVCNSSIGIQRCFEKTYINYERCHHVCVLVLLLFVSTIYTFENDLLTVFDGLWWSLSQQKMCICWYEHHLSSVWVIEQNRLKSKMKYASTSNKGKIPLWTLWGSMRIHFPHFFFSIVFTQLHIFTLSKHQVSGFSALLKGTCWSQLKDEEIVYPRSD